ncbi:MAG: hypothetical protein HY036_09835 [Nitrospirae bacterium]|nr:hypothetical protein [Nitrospirota bacterium]MBI3352865.1 hypothetical protein [Nitrospirota bacterium]
MNSLLRTLFIFILTLISFDPTVKAESLMNKWGIGLRGGPSFVTQDIADQQWFSKLQMSTMN